MCVSPTDSIDEVKRILQFSTKSGLLYPGFKPHYDHVLGNNIFIHTFGNTKMV